MEWEMADGELGVRDKASRYLNLEGMLIIIAEVIIGWCSDSTAVASSGAADKGCFALCAMHI